MTVLLNGKFVRDDGIDPGKHKFIGTFREPYKLPETSGYILCSCGQTLQSTDQSFKHWQSGHWDILQYVDIESPEEEE